MKLRIEIDPQGEEEIVIRSRTLDDRVTHLQESIHRLTAEQGDLALFDGEREIFCPLRELLFFESYDGHLYAHTARACFVCRKRLYELEQSLPRTFVRASKACLVNTARISSLSRSLTGVTEVGFYSSEKKITLSRMYYHNVRNMITSTRLNMQKE